MGYGAGVGAPPPPHPPPRWPDAAPGCSTDGERYYGDPPSPVPGLELHATAGRARACTVHLPAHAAGTPFFLPVGSQASVKGVAPTQLAGPAVDAQGGAGPHRPPGHLPSGRGGGRGRRPGRDEALAAGHPHRQWGLPAGVPVARCGDGRGGGDQLARAAGVEAACVGGGRVGVGGWGGAAAYGRRGHGRRAQRWRRQRRRSPTPPRQRDRRPRRSQWRLPWRRPHRSRWRRRGP
ncbi:hypothetical protein I4F81_003824 [Pyropia yezoensis]|uniref:Uncharacterized protein n=1 Tax=Pyropia yezoensis TaxID=2788 RepID=A0ACC3BTF1_PYRYE|nr:hypothetical protein I4F81_003824 [Neopyropia yezoensis]